MKKIILKHVLLNATEHNGKAVESAVLGKVLAEDQKMKKDIDNVRKEIVKIVKKVNSWSLSKQNEELKKFGKIKKPEKKQREGLPSLPNAKMGKVVTRMPPEPSKYPHIGHALSFLINYIYAKRYKGKSVLRFEDTNPLKSKQEYVDAILEDLNYLGIKPNKTVFISDDMKKIYTYAEKAIKKGKAYVCRCEMEKVRSMRHKGEECKCRWKDKKDNLKLWKDMLNKKFKEGEAVLRLKGDMKSKNHVMRDPAVFRITYAKHYRQGEKYCVWPLYDFANAIEDELCGVTHVLRSSEFGTMRQELQKFIKDMFGFKNQTEIQYGRFQVTGAIVKGREVRRLIENGKYSGWDDPRLVTIRALKKRGIVKKTFYDLAESLGLSKTSPRIGWEMIASFNRKNIDKTSPRYFCVCDPVEMKLDKVPGKNVKAPLFPGKRKYRTIPISKKIYIDKIDFVSNHGKETRLMHFGNVVIDKKAKFKSKKLKDIKKIHWVSNKNVKIKLVMPNKTLECLAEPDIKKVKPDQIVQFERIGFARCEKKGEFYFSHK